MYLIQIVTPNNSCITQQSNTFSPKCSFKKDKMIFRIDLGTFFDVIVRQIKVMRKLHSYSHITIFTQMYMIQFSKILKSENVLNKAHEYKYKMIYFEKH